MTVIADTGALFALVDRDDSWHHRMISWWKENTKRVLVPVTVLPEVCYLLQTRIGPAAEERFMHSVARGEIEIEYVDADDVVRSSELVAAYSDMPLGFVDASIVAVAERMETRDLLTTDRRHFAMVRPARARRFNLLP